MITQQSTGPEAVALLADAPLHAVPEHGLGCLPVNLYINESAHFRRNESSGPGFTCTS
jgi:hypothetical protein